MQDKTQKTLNDISLIAMSDVDIHKHLPDVRIVKYSDLVDYNSISDLLPKQRDAIIILTEQIEAYGHGLRLLDTKIKLFISIHLVIELIKLLHGVKSNYEKN